MPYQIEVGAQVVEFPDSVGQDEAQRVLSEQFPATGEDIAGAMQDPTFTPTKSDYLKYEEYSKTKQTDWINTAAQAADAVIGIIGGAISEGAQGAVGNPRNYIEAFAQGTRQLYGLAAQSQDPSSALFRFKDLVAGTGTSDSRYAQFLDAREFGKKSSQLERGETGIAFPPELTNPEFVQGLSTILDPTLIIPGVGEMFGMGKLATRAVGKGAQLTGRAVAGVAKPLERFAGAAERIAAETVGMTPEALRSTAATAGIAGALGIAPEVATLAAIPAGIRTAREAGEALSRAGENLMTQPSRIGPLEAIGAVPGANMRQRILGVIGQYGGDAALDSSLRGLAGGIEGAAIGTGLGYLSGGEEGAASGLGAGVAQGAVGALGARGLQKLTGAAAKEARAGDLGRFINSQQDPTTKALFKRVRDQHGVDAASSLMDLQGLVRGKFGDVEVIYRNNKDFADQFGGTARGVQVDDLGGRPAVVINADIIGKGTGDGPLYTLGHELFHALEKSTQLEGGATEIKDSLVGRWVQEGDVVRKLSEGAFNDAEINARFNEYRDKLSAGNQERADQLAQYDTIDKKAGYVASELAAEHFAGLLAGQKPDALLKGFTGITRQLLDSALTQNASRALADAAATIERTFGVKPTDSVLFPDLKQASPQVNAMLRNLLRARRKLDERITIENDGPGKVLKPQDVSNPIAAKQLIDLGVAEQMPDGSVRNLSDQEINAREEKDTTAIRSILEGVPGARVVDGEILGRFSPQQLSAIEMSQAVSSRMKDKIRAVNTAMDAGNSIFVNYGAATKRVKNRQTGKFTSKYNSGIRLSQREVLPYSFYLSKADNPVIKAIDISKIRGALDKLTAPDGSVAKGIWGSVDGFMSDLAGYFTNLDAGEGARRSAEIFGLEKAKYLGDFVNEQEKGGRKFVRDFRLDRIGSTTPMDFRARISEDAIQKSKMRWMPAEKLGDKSITNSEEGYRIISGAKHKLYGTDGKLIGIYDTQTQAERKAERDYTIQKQSTRTWFDSNYDSWKKAQSMRTEFTPEERNAVSIAKKKSIETFRKYPEAIRLDIKVDREGNPKFEQVLDANENPVVDANGKPVMEVAFTKVPYDLLGSPKLSKNKDRAVVQAADLLDADARKAFNNPDISKGIGWYSRMREFLQQQFGANIEVFGQLLGATSARTPVDTNFKQALEALKLLSTGQYDGLLAEFSKHANKTYADSQSGELLKQWQAKNPDKRASAFKVDDEVRKQINKFEGVPLRPNGKKYNANSQKVLHVLYGLWLEQTVGPKTPNFAGNLTGRTLKATIDVWAARNLRRLLYEGSREKWRLLPEQESGVTDPDFFFAQDVYEVVGKRLGVNPDDLQALMWFMEKDVWEKNGWTSTVGAEKSSFDKEAGKLALDRYQAGVTTFTELKNFKFDTQEKERLALRKSIIGLEGLVASRVNNSSGLYDGVFEPSLDVEFSVSKNRDGSTKSIANQILEIIRVANQPERLQKDVFISQIVPIDHPNARPIMEVGFKKGAAWDDIAEVVTAFQKNGIDGFTIATDNQGNVIGIRAQYLPEFSAVFDSLDHLDPQMVKSKMQDWVSRVNAASTALDQIDNVSYKKNGTVSTIVYGFEEYATARPIEPGNTSRAAELGRRRPIAEQRRQVSSGSDAGQAVDPGAGGLPTPAGDVQSAGSPSSQEVGGQRFMPAGDMATGRSVKDHREAMDLFEKGYRLYGALYDGMEDPIRLKKVTEIEKYDPENLWAVPSKKQSRDIGIRNMPADADYLSAVKQGNTKAAQQMVDEAAKAAGVNRKIDPTKIRTFWRVGKPPEGGQSYNTKDQFFEKGVSTYFYPEATSFAGMDRSDWYKVSGEFVGYGSDGEPLVKVESFKKGTPREIDAALKKKPILQLLPGDSFRFPKYSSYADRFTVRSVKRRKDGSLYGYEISSSGIAKDYPIGTEIPNYRKLGPEYLAEDELGVTDITYAPITKDDAGNVIPLSQRFKATSDDIRYMPADIKRDIGRNVDFANPPTAEKAVDALSSEKKSFWRKHDELPEGSSVGVRIDIPAFLNRGTYVQTIHKSATPGDVGDRIGYDTSVRLSGPVKFFVKEGSSESSRGAVAIKEGRTKKHPIATVEGKLIKDRSVPPDIEDWTPVGMDPKKHSYFYDKRTDQPVIGGSESYSVGNTVFVKDPVPGNPSKFAFMPQPDAAMPGAYSFPGGYRALPGKAKGSLRLYGPAGSLVGIASSLDEAQRILRRKNK